MACTEERITFDFLNSSSDAKKRDRYVENNWYDSTNDIQLLMYFNDTNRPYGKNLIRCARCI